MSIVDGTTSELKCFQCNYSTTNIDEWNKHLREPGHYSVGSGNCAVCGEEYVFTVEDKVPSAMVARGLIVHPECQSGSPRGKGAPT